MEHFRPVYMLDADTCAAILQHCDEALMQRLERMPVTDLCLSAITQSELVFAANTSRYSEQDGQALDMFLKHVVTLAYPSEAAKDYGSIREGLYWREEMIGLHELLVAAHARSMGLTLVTSRVKEFGRVPGLRVESWGG